MELHDASVGGRLINDDQKDCKRDIKKKINLCLGLLNIRSIVSKYYKIYELINDGLDILVLTETWHQSSVNICLKLAMPPHFTFVDFLRTSDPHHGGIIIYFKSNFKNSIIELPLFKTIEVVAIKFFIRGIEIVLLALYRPGSMSISPLFFEELMSVLEKLSISASFIILAGDFNVHLERSFDAHTIRLLEIFDFFHLSNRVSTPTHIMGGILDLIVSSVNFQPLNCDVYPHV